MRLFWRKSRKVTVNTSRQNIGKHNCFSQRNVGLFKYYNWKNLPNFVLAFSSLVIYLCGIFNLGLSFDWIVLWSFLCFNCIFVSNVQILTRLVSFGPIYYWTLAFLVAKRRYFVPKMMILYGIVSVALFALFYPPA